MYSIISMKFQSPKRGRAIRRKQQALSKPDAYKNQLEDPQMWLYHPIETRDANTLVEITDTLEGGTVIPKLGRLSMTLLSDLYIHGAITRSSKRRTVTSEEIFESISPKLEQFEGLEREVAIAGLAHFGGRRPQIGLVVQDQELQEFQKELYSDIHQYLAVKRTLKPRLHITLAHGNISDITNKDKIASALPESVSLKPLRVSRRFDTHRTDEQVQI
jgi:hypothetical protein